MSSTSLRDLFRDAMRAGAKDGSGNGNRNGTGNGNGLESVHKSAGFKRMLENVYEFMITKEPVGTMTPQKAGVAMILIDFVPLMTTVDDMVQWIPRKASITKPEFVAHMASVYGRMIQTSSFRATKMLLRESINETDAGKLMNNLIDDTLTPVLQSNPYMSNLERPGVKTQFGLSKSIRTR